MIFYDDLCNVFTVQAPGQGMGQSAMSQAGGQIMRPPTQQGSVAGQMPGSAVLFRFLLIILLLL